MRSGGAVALIEKRADDHDARHLAMRARGWLQRNARQSGDFREMLLEFVNHLKRALRVVFFSQWMEIREAGDSRHSFVEARVVFHRTRAKWIHAEIDRVVPGR